jgi:hypothetical protein
MVNIRNLTMSLHEGTKDRNLANDIIDVEMVSCFARLNMKAMLYGLVSLGGVVSMSMLMLWCHMAHASHVKRDAGNS